MWQKFHRGLPMKKIIISHMKDIKILNVLEQNIKLFESKIEDSDDMTTKFTLMSIRNHIKSANALYKIVIKEKNQSTIDKTFRIQIVVNYNFLKILSLF